VTSGVLKEEKDNFEKERDIDRKRERERNEKHPHFTLLD
jgi:hypothetical protein